VPYSSRLVSKIIGHGESQFDLMMLRNSNVNKLKMTSEAASQLFEDQSLDFCYIDAEHKFESVNKDIQLWLPKVKNGGWIAGHDISIPGVSAAVVKNFPNKEWVKFIDTSWLIHKKRPIRMI
jgi:predicted O-methyltransferase YrrM